jgi:hypothetical protein
VRGWLSSTNPVEVLVVCDHSTLAVGHFLSFIRSADRILTTCTVDDSPAGSLLLRGWRNGDGAGQSRKY